MAAQTHIIARQVLEVGVARREEAHEAQERVSRVYRHEILPRLEGLFDRLVGPDTTVRLDRLEVDLGHIESGQLDYELVDRVLRQVAEVLEDELSGIPREEVAGDRTRLPQPERVLTDWLYFLEHGRLPWPGRIEDWAGWEKEIATLLDREHGIRSALHALLSRIPRSIERLLLQFGDPVVTAAARTLSARLGPLVEVLERAVRNAPFSMTPVDGHTTRRRLFWIQVLALIYPAASRPGGLAYLTDRLLERWSQLARIPRPVLLEALDAGLEARDSLKGLDERARVRLPEVVEVLKRFQVDLSEKDDRKRDAEEPAEDLQVEDAEEEFPEAEGWIVPCAGIVLAHPFLVTLFETLHLVKEQIFLDEDARRRAVHIIHYLATGRTEHPEPDLAMGKILCGMPVREPIQRAIVLTEEEMNECRLLLEAVIGHWRALKNTSPEGLREAFLQREGTLSHSSAGWHLNVRQKTEDILLGGLPWGIGMIRLPWMDEMMHVNWR